MEKISMNSDWKFRLETEPVDCSYGFMKTGRATAYASFWYDDSAWRTVNLPHDWGVELGFDLNADGSHGHRTITAQNCIKSDEYGNPVNMKAYPVGWYRKKFFVPESKKDTKFILAFEGIYRDSIIWINGTYYDRHSSGYVGMHYDITDDIQLGKENVIAVRVNAAQFEGWWYEGAGIYRNVWMYEGEKVYIPLNETRIVPKNSGEVLAESLVRNDSTADFNGQIRYEILDPEGNVCASERKTVSVAAYEEVPVRCLLQVSGPRLWDLDTPWLYTVQITVESEGKTVDIQQDTFGFREVRFDTEEGFFLNGKSVKLHGVCVHQDFAGVGVALTRGMQFYKIAKLKEMGVNAYRSSHHPPAPELLEACDRLGILVMAEQRYCSSSPEGLRQLEYFVKLDRNHPSIILWSIGNEEMMQGTRMGGNIATTIRRYITKWDGTRLLTYAGNNGSEFEGINSKVDVRGINYIRIGAKWDEYHAEHAAQPVLGSEEASTVMTRGQYENSLEKGYVTAYEDNTMPWGSTAIGWNKFYEERKWLCGGFAWTGIDYRGEPSPFKDRDNVSNFGILDLCCFPKDVYYYYQSWWQNEDVLHLLPHWNHQPGDRVRVFVYTNCDRVELLLNGRKIAESPVEYLGQALFTVAYEPGTLEAVGYRNGREIMRDSRTTAGEPARAELSLTGCRQLDEEGVFFVEAQLADAKGNRVDHQDTMLYFSAEGAELLGLGNGDPASMEPEQYLPVNLDIPFGGWQVKCGSSWADTDVTLPFRGKELLDVHILDTRHHPNIREEGPTEPFYDLHRTVWIAQNPNLYTAEYRCVLQGEGKEEILYFPYLAGGYQLYINDRLVKEVSLQDYQTIQLIGAECAVPVCLQRGSNVLRLVFEYKKLPGGIYRGSFIRRSLAPGWKMNSFAGKCLAICRKTAPEAKLTVTCQNGTKTEIVF